MPLQGSGSTRHPAELQAHVTHHPDSLSPHRRWCTKGSRSVLEVSGKGGRGQRWSTAPVVPSELFWSVFWCDEQSRWELSCLITGPCNNFCNSRCCGLQGLEIPCIRNVGVGLESWNFIWEHLSIHHKCIVNRPANLSFSGFGCTCKGLRQLENTMCKQIPGTAGAGQKHGPEYRSESSLWQLICIFSGFEPFCTWCSRAQCFEKWPYLSSTGASLFSSLAML